MEGENRACGSADVALVGGVVEGVAEGEGFGEGGNADVSSSSNATSNQGLQKDRTVPNLTIIP